MRANAPVARPKSQITIKQASAAGRILIFDIYILIFNMFL